MPDIRISDDAYLDGAALLYINGSSNLVDVNGDGYSYTSEMNNVNLQILNSYLSGNVYGGGFGNVNGSVNVNIDHSTVRGNVYGCAVGKTYEWSVSVGNNNADVSKPPTGFPVYYTTAQTSHPLYSVLGIAENQVSAWGGDITSANLNKNTVQFNYYLFNPTSEEANLTIKNSIIGYPSKALDKSYGNVYNGGRISKVTGNGNAYIINSTVYGNVYNGGDGITKPDYVIIDAVVSSSNYVVPDRAKFTEDINNIYQNPSHLSYTEKDYIDGEHYGKQYKWSDDTTVLNNGGIDDDNRLVYSPYMSNWGDVNGDTTANIVKCKIKGNVYAGANNANVGGDTKLTISYKSTIDGNVIGSGEQTTTSGNSDVYIYDSHIKGDVCHKDTESTISGEVNIDIDENSIIDGEIR